MIKRNKKTRSVSHGTSSWLRILPLLVFIAIVIGLGYNVPRFLTLGNMINVLRQSAALGFMAIGVTVVMITGGIDLSIPSVMALGGIVGSLYMREGGNPVIGSLIMVTICASLGAINGYAVAYLKMVPFVVTLSMMYIVTGISVWLTREVSVAGLPANFLDGVMRTINGFPVIVIVLLVIAVFVYIMMTKSIYGRWLYAVGSNQQVAGWFGIPQAKVVFRSYVFSSFFAGLAAIVTTARLASASATMGSEGIVLNVIGAAVIGGVSIYGAAGNVLGAVVGAFFITMIGNIMNMMRVSYYMTLFFTGIVILAVIAFDTWRKNKGYQ